VGDLFALDEFASYVQQDVDTSTATVVRRVASGWLKDVTGLADFPTPIPDDLFAWGLELAAIAFRNPDGAASESVDDHNVSWDMNRRKDILKAALIGYSTTGQPQYAFPDPDWHWSSVTPTSAITA
jgi:hypothetical protein